MMDLICGELVLLHDRIKKESKSSREAYRGAVGCYFLLEINLIG